MAFPAWGLVGAVGAGYKVLQALTDEQWPGTEFPKEFRQALIDEYWDSWGGFCWGCWKRGHKKSDYTVDHIVPIRKGGRNSKHNARVICGPCNSRKGDRVSLWDEFWGRGGSRPRRRE